MRKAINFDIDTKKYEKHTGRKAPTAYAEIKQFLKKNGFEHRQGSGYISIFEKPLPKVSQDLNNMGNTFPWLKHCIKRIDATSLGDRYDMLDVIKD